MASRSGTVATLVGVAVLVGLLGAGVVLIAGLELGVWIVVLGVPAVVIAGVVVYVRGVVNRESTGTSEFLEDRARNTGVQFRETVTTYTQLRESYPGWETDALDAQLDGLADDFAAAGVQVNTHDGGFTVEDPSSPREFEQLESDVSAFADARDESFRKFAREEIRSMETALAELTPEILADGAASVATPEEVPDDGGPEAVERVIERVRSGGVDRIETATEAIEETITEYERDPDTIREQLDAATASAEQASFDEAVRQLGQATSVVESEVGGEFAADREAMEQLIETVNNSRAGEFVSEDRLDEVAHVTEELRGVGSAMDTDRLADLEARLRRACQGMIGELSSDLDEDIRTISSADVPVGFYEAPPAAGTDYETELAGVESLETFRMEWLSAVGELTDALETASEKAAVADSYSMIADRIDDRLRTDGRVTGDDLPVTNPAQFMQLYAESADEVTYDATVPALSVPGGGETYDLTVRAQLADHDGSQHGFDVRVSGDGYDETRHHEEYVASQSQFRNLPYGEYDLTVSVADDAFADATRSVRVTSDETVTVEIERLSLAERVCGGDRSAVEAQLPTVAAQLESRFEEQSDTPDERYLTADMDLPVTDEYAPCLLALWADEEGHDARLDGGRVLVYDHDGVAQRVTYAVEERVVTGGETITLEAIRDGYLSVPVSNELIETIIDDAGLAVTIEGREVRPT